jgi:hypothetical protein
MPPNLNEKQSLSAVCTKRLKRPLEREEAQFVASVESLFQSHGSAHQLAADAVNKFLRNHRPVPTWELVILWPRRPADSWEAWLYLMVFIRSRGATVPPFLAEVTQESEIEALDRSWAQQETLRIWEENLHRMVTEIDQFSRRISFEARLLIGAAEARFQYLLPDKDDWISPSDWQFAELVEEAQRDRLDCSQESRLLLDGFNSISALHGSVGYARMETREKLVRLILNPLLEEHVVSETGTVFNRSQRRLKWRLRSETDIPGAEGFYLLDLVFEDGESPDPPLFTVGGSLNCYITAESIYRTAPLLRFDPKTSVRIPVRGLDSSQAVRLLRGIGVEIPREISERVVDMQPEVRLRCWLESRAGEERLCLQATARFEEEGTRFFSTNGWEPAEGGNPRSGRILIADETLMHRVPRRLSELSMRDFRASDDSWVRLIGKRFPEEFAAWVESNPPGIILELEGDLESFRSAVIRGRVELEAKETGLDWFDLRVALSLSDTELTKEEIQLLMEARGKFVRLTGKGWHRLEFEMDDDDAEQLSEMGLNPADFNGPPQRFHALQLAGDAAQRLLEKNAREGIQRRVEQLQVCVTPEVPKAISATLRSYQVEGFHFLAYLSTNSFGGILADDMGLGKTLQTLAWIAWLRQQPDYDRKQVLVVCPKSVVQNWVSEANRFLPGLRTLIWRGGTAKDLQKAAAHKDLVVVNYTQLRISADVLTNRVWHSVVLDEAQYIKNPASQTAVAAFALQGKHRLALSGTPIENRLMDLWSIMQFAMPGLLGLRTHFQRHYDARADVLARRRLAARVRPFVLRRTKKEVAKDLPDRIEEDVLVEMEGKQKTLYTAELKRARKALLKIKTNRELDKDRFNILTSLLRLRQICCHPGLVSGEHGYADSAKMEALTDLLEPLVELGHKVLVFSQFVEMLDRVERELNARNWTSFLLTGETENRAELVDEFQSHPGAAVFLISLRAGGMGLNLTAASYVILFDPWWNPAVENQAIDRTHRIGQTRQVIAYRLVAKNSIEEKIRQLQRAKSAMAGDILGEESFAKALTLEDFNFLMEDPGESGD